MAPREIVEIPISRRPESVALFAATLAYPDDCDQRYRFGIAFWRDQLRARAAEEDVAFGSQRGLIPYELFLMTDADTERAMREGSKQLAKRKAAYIYTATLFAEAESGQEISYIEAFGTRAENTAEGRARLTKYWQDRSWDKDAKSAQKNLGQREIKGSLPVIHAAVAYFEMVRLLLKVLVGGSHLYASEEEVERKLLRDRDFFRLLLARAEFPPRDRAVHPRASRRRERPHRIPRRLTEVSKKVAAGETSPASNRVIRPFVRSNSPDDREGRHGSQDAERAASARGDRLVALDAVAENQGRQVSPACQD